MTAKHLLLQTACRVITEHIVSPLSACLHAHVPFETLRASDMVFFLSLLFLFCRYSPAVHVCKMLTLPNVAKQRAEDDTTVYTIEAYFLRILSQLYTCYFAANLSASTHTALELRRKLKLWHRCDTNYVNSYS